MIKTQGVVGSIYFCNKKAKKNEQKDVKGKCPEFDLFLNEKTKKQKKNEQKDKKEQ